MKKKISRLLKGALAVSMTLSTLMISSNTKRVSAAELEDDYTQYVDCFTGTQGDHGILFPGSVVPNGIVSLSPDTSPGSRVGYDYGANDIRGFTHTRVSGVGGGGAGGDVLVMPTYMNYTKRPDKNSYKQKFYKVDGKKVEEAHPGYYFTEIVPNIGTDSTYESNTSIGNIEAKMTTDIRTGLHNYTFPKEGNASLVVDLNNNINTGGGRDHHASINVEKDENGYVSISGYSGGRNVLWSGNGSLYTIYYHLEINKPVTDVSTWENDASLLGTNMNLTGKDIGAVLNFDVKEGETIQAKVTISPISEEQAKIDMHNEMPDWDFDKTRDQAKDMWNDVLGKIRVENSEKSDPDNRLKKLFYTNYYHMFMAPMNATSTDGKWMGNDRSLHEVDGYTHYDCWTFWDDYRKFSILGLTNPEFYRDVAQSTIDMLTTGYHDNGLKNQPVMTVRNEYAITVVADAISQGVDPKGLRDLDKAYEQAIKIVENHTKNSKYDYVDGNLDTTLTTCFEYWGIANIAKALGKDAEAKKYFQKALGYKNMFREDAPISQYFNGEQIGILWPKHTPDAGGSWIDCDPAKYSALGLSQGTVWQYLWYNGFDYGGLIDMMGGKDKAEKVLSFIFGEQDPNNGKAMLHCNVNEIDPHVPFAFNYVGKPSKTQYWTRQIYSKKSWNRYSGTGEYNPPIYDYVYKLEPKGYLQTMDDDAGAMSAMYVSAAMGLLPVTPGDTNIQIGSPFFEKITLDLGNGKTFTIEANNVSEDNFYIQSAKFNGKEFNRSWIDYSELVNGGTLSFEMGDKPSTWAEDGPDAFSLSDYVDYEVEKVEPDFSKFEAESGAEYNGGVHPEDDHVGNTRNNSWIKYAEVDLSTLKADSIKIRYAGNTGRCAPDAHVEMRLDAPDGELVSTINILPQSPDWKTYVEVSEKLAKPELLQGVHDVYFVLKGTTTDSLPYIANIDYFELPKIPTTVRLEAEAFDETDGVKNEGSNIGSTNNGEWIKFNQVDFAEITFNELKVRYTGNTSNCAPDARIEVRIDNRETGELIAKVDTPPTGSWSSYTTVSGELLKPELLKGKHDVYVTFLGSSGSWIGNYDWFEFGEKEIVVVPEPGDKTELQKLYDENVKLLEESNKYELTGFKAFEHAMYNAKTVLAADDSIQREVDAAILTLEKAIAGLELNETEPAKPADKTALQIAVEMAETITDEKLETVIPAVKAEFEAALAEAKALLADEYATQDEIDASFIRLSTAMHMLDFVKGDKSALQELVDKAKEYKAEDYTKATWNNLQTVIAEAEELLRDENAMQAEIDEMVAKLQAAIDGLVKLADKSKLANLVEKVGNLVSDKYLPDTWAKFAEALANAEAVLEAQEPTQAEVDAAYNELIRGYLNLRLVPNKDALGGLVNKAKALNEPALANAIAGAEAVLAKADATQEEITAAYNTLNTAITTLTPVKGGDTTVNSGVKTGDAVNMIVPLAGLLVAGYALTRKKED